VLLGWGSTYGALREATDLLNREGLATRMLHFPEIYPFPPLDFLGSIGRNASILAVEGNYTGQFADWFQGETGLPISGKILKYDGRPFSPQEIAARVKERL
jgi:2-oxoglutarate ferredoxin oxidoreductase subunit alpha